MRYTQGFSIPVHQLLADSPGKTKTLFRVCFAPETGIEPVTNRLTGDCSTAELLRNTLLFPPLKLFNHSGMSNNRAIISKIIENAMNNHALIIESSAFKNNEIIPAKFTCDGKGINPQLSIKGVPPEAKSLVLFMEDPDIPTVVKKNYNIDVWDHWIMFDIPPTTTEILEGVKPLGVMGKNTQGTNDYHPPCPPDKEHRYIFRVFALDKVLSLPFGSKRELIEIAIHNHVLAEGELVGRYNSIN